MMDSKVIFNQSKNGLKPYRIPKIDIKREKLSKYINKNFLRNNKARLPEVSEPEVVRHFSNLSVKNHHVDKNFYPLGSCTMKYNPKINDSIAMMSEFSGAHPLQDVSSIQGILKVYYDLGELLCKITEMDGITLQPSAGSQGEFVGLLLMKKYHEIKKNKSKKYIIIPKTAHGTNPASVIMSGYLIKQVDSDDRGRVCIKHLKELVDDETAGMMLTQPNTLGLFEDNIEQISDLIHSYDGLMYMDGANLNALVGMVSPYKMGFDITHINVHKTFSTPHGGGGPGAGPVAVNSKLTKFLPNPIIQYDKKRKYYSYENLKDSIGYVHSFLGNFGVLLRAYVYIRILGKGGLRNISRTAVLNANYLKFLLSDCYHVPFSDGTMHEFVISAVSQKEKGLKALDIAKNLLDYGFHAPTIYFPINVPESIMIEPTETEKKETLESFANAMNEMSLNIDSKIDYYKEAPYNTPVRKLNEAKANRELDVKWNYKDELS
ncbi:MAG: glycine dehydrogenase (aminomethyl-transferring) [Candidatus Marinimicrobia bacterium]|nr:glycine dehydrogenase (aminomethyl-transferring) [Candidatus Neomarinimicrobiota bacterium]